MQARLACSLSIALATAFCAVLHAQAEPTQFVLKPSSSPHMIAFRDALRRAALKNPDLLVAREKLEQQRGTMRRSLAQYLPKLKLNGSWTGNYPEIKAALSNRAQNVQQAQLYDSVASLIELTPNTDPIKKDAAAAQASQLHEAANALRRSNPLSIVIQPASVFDASLILTQPIFDWSAYTSIQGASLDLSREENMVAKQLSDSLANVGRAYLQAVRGQRLVHIAESQKVRALQQLKRMRQKYKDGFARRSDVYRMEIAFNSANDQLIQARSNQKFMYGALGLLLGEEEEFQIEGTIHIAEIERDKTSDELVSQALAAREDIQIQRTAKRIAEQAESHIWASFFPTLDLAVQGNYTSNTAGFVSKAFRGAIMLQANMNLFDGGERYGQLRETRAQIRTAQIQLLDLQQHVNADVRGRLTDAETKKAILLSAEQAVRLQSLIYADSDKMYRSRLLDVMDLIEANQQLYESEVALENSRTDLELARMELGFVCGYRLDGVEGGGKWVI